MEARWRSRAQLCYERSRPCWMMHQMHYNAARRTTTRPGSKRVALGAVLGILELGAAKRADDEEAALKALLEPLEALSSPTRRASSFAQLAVDCRARILCRGMATQKKTVEEEDTLLRPNGH